MIRVAAKEDEDLSTDKSQLDEATISMRGSLPIYNNPVDLGPQINTTYTETTPELSQDGLMLLFSSDRPGGFGDHDLWMSTRPTVHEAFSNPVNLGPNVNSADRELGPSMAPDGLSMWFTNATTGQLHATKRASVHEPFGPATVLDWPVNRLPSQPSEGIFNVTVFADSTRRTLIFETIREQPGIGRTGRWDLAIANKTIDTVCDHSEILGGPFSTVLANDGGPELSADGLILLFHSSRPGGQKEHDDLWYTSRVTLESDWEAPKKMSSPINSPQYDSFPTLSGDGTLVFASNRGKSPSDYDLWLAAPKDVEAHHLPK
ncbi:MAG: hypothetical protein R3C05_18370 [Pirellulaceae bacterium]